MNTSPTLSNYTLQISSPIRVTSEAVELRDRQYPLRGIGAARVVRVRPDNFSVRLGAMAFAYCLGSLAVLLVQYFAELVRNGGQLFQIRSGYSLFTAASDNTFKTILFVLAVLLVVGAFLISRLVSIGKNYLYAASLRSPLWGTTIAASQDRAPIEELVSAVNRALNEKRQGGVAGETSVYYDEQNAAGIDDTWLELPGNTYAVASLKFATSYTIQAQPLIDTIKSFGAVGLLLGVLNALTGNPTSNEIPWGPFVLYLALGALASGFILLVNRSRGGPLGIIYVCHLRTVYEEVTAFISMDRVYTNSIVVAINRAVTRNHEL